MAEWRHQVGCVIVWSLVRARRNFSVEGQRSGRIRVNWHAERVSRPAREKNRCRSVNGGGKMGHVGGLNVDS